MSSTKSSGNGKGGPSIAQQTFELNNSIQTVDGDSIYAYDNEGQRAIQQARPWRSDPHHFKHVRISAIALVKMVTHARSGGQYEIMGLMQGKIEDETFVVMDAFALPVLGTETRVNAGAEGDEYSVQYQTICKEVNRPENVVGWYHSHPGYGCWLSGIDVSTQLNNQIFDPFLAVVIDPNRTVSAGKVEIGAFRAYPENYTPPNAQASEYQSIPLNKIEDFGVHSSRYYSLDISFFKSSLDNKLLEMLWNKYWVMTLGQSPLISNRAYTTSQISDLTEKLSKTENSIATRASVAALVPEALESKQSGSGSGGRGKGKDAANSDPDGVKGKTDETPLSKVVKDSKKLTTECNHGLISQILKDMLFNNTTMAQAPSTNSRGGRAPDARLQQAVLTALA